MVWARPFKSVLFAQIALLPDHLEGLAEEDIRKVYPLYKIGKALLREEAVDRGQLHLLIKLFGKIPPKSPGLYGPLLRLSSLGALTSDPIEEDKTKDLELFLSVTTEGREFIARELLMAGEAVPVVNYHMFASSPLTREVAIQLSEWCLQNPRLCIFQHIPSLIASALILNRSDLADRALSRIAALPNDANTIIFKVLSFVLYKNRVISDERFSQVLISF